MTPSQLVRRDLRARNEAGKLKSRPNVGPIVTGCPAGLLGEAYEKCLDALNCIGELPWVDLDLYTSDRLKQVQKYINAAAELLATDVRDGTLSRPMTLADLAARPVEIDRAEQLETALDDIRDACGREGSTMTPSEVSQLAVERIATLESGLAAELERNAALAALVAEMHRFLDRETESDYADGDEEWPRMTTVRRQTACGLVDLIDRANAGALPILAAHNAEVGRKAKVEALESFLEIGRDDYLGPRTMLGMEIRRRIAALKAEGGQG